MRSKLSFLFCDSFPGMLNNPESVLMPCKLLKVSTFVYGEKTNVTCCTELVVHTDRPGSPAHRAATSAA